MKCIVLMYSCVCQLHYSAKCIASRPHCACVPLGQVHCVKVTCVVAMCQCMCEPHCCAKCVAPSPLRQVRCAKCTVPSALCYVHCSMCQVHCANALPSALRPSALCQSSLRSCACACVRCIVPSACQVQVHCAKRHCAIVPSALRRCSVPSALFQVHCVSAKCIAPMCQVHCVKANCIVLMYPCMCQLLLVPSALRQVRCAQCIVSR